MFRVYDVDGRSYEGYIFSPDNSIKATNFYSVVKILNHYGVINITGHDEIMVPKITIKSWILLQPI